MTRRLELGGKKFGRLLVIKFLYTKPNGAYWECICDCGNIAEVRGAMLTKDNTKSCGCFRKEYVANKNFKHGFAERDGQYKSEYHAYLNAKRRCENKQDTRYEDYGGRGIQFLFDSFAEFLSEIGAKPEGDFSLDRINNDLNYEKGNIKWSTRIEQQNNRRDYYEWTKVKKRNL